MKRIGSCPKGRVKEKEERQHGSRLVASFALGGNDYCRNELALVGSTRTPCNDTIP